MRHFSAHDPSIAHRRRPRRSVAPSCEPLDSRRLLSSSPFSSLNSSLSSLLFQKGPAKNPPLVPRPVSSELPKNVSGRIQGLYELSLTQHTLYQGTVLGHFVKAPMFNPGFTGPKRLDLDVIGTVAHISPQQGLQLTGEVLGPIDPAQPAIYSFLIDRGGASGPGSIHGHSPISYDLEVTVTDGPGGPVGTVSALNSQQQATSTVTLPASSVEVIGPAVQVSIPSSLLPSTVPPGAYTATLRDSYVFETAVPGGRPSDLAGFAPGFLTSQVVHAGSTRH
jgi:hypothetical protein